MNQIGLMIAFFALIYFMMIRPQQKQQKQRKEMLNSLRIGNNIVTIGGIHGIIKALKEENAVIEIAVGVEITILKSAIGQVVAEEDISEDVGEPDLITEPDEVINENE